MAESGDGKTPARLAAGCIDPGETIAALRERGGHRLDPIRFRFIEAMARRAAAHEGDTRHLLDRRLAQLLCAYEEGFDHAPPQADAIPGIAGHPGGLRSLAARPDGQGPRGPLADLLHHIAGQASENGGGSPAPAGVAETGSSAELKTLRYFRSTWSQLSVDQRLNRSMAKVPENAGPLNSHVLALRSLKLMRDLSPAYLHRFMSYLDALQWLEQAHEASAALPRDAARGDGDRKPKVARKRSG